MFNVLFLCTGNSARSVLSEGWLNHIGGGRFKAFSAGSKPRGKVNPFALAALKAQGASTESYRSKSWDEFAGDGAPQMDIIITVCGNAQNETEGEACPVWPHSKNGERPATAYWGYDDPAKSYDDGTGTDTEIEAAFEDVFAQIRTRIEALVALSDDAIQQHIANRTLKDIGA
ncbi:MAG: arsenate reductase ArsC [Alphaproteobacteria bacterium]